MVAYTSQLATIVILLGTLTAGCGGGGGVLGTKPTGDPGLCSLNCSDALIASSNFKFEVLTDPLKVRCSSADINTDTSGRNSVPRSYTAKFRVYKEQNGQPIPIPYVSINPFISGNVGLYSENSSNVTYGVKTDSGQIYDGISTPPENWCSDSCGAITLTIHPRCPSEESNEVNVTLFSGSLKSDPYAITMIAPAEDESE